jgi:hypothetical protein
MNMKLKTTMICSLYLTACGILTIGTTSAQQDSTFKPSGKVWGYVFGDYAIKAHADSTTTQPNGSAPSGSQGTGTGTARQLTSQNQYSNILNNPNYSAFNIRRMYLGYDYDMSPKFSATIVLAHESGAESNTTTEPSLTSDNKRAMYVKYANVRWKNIFPNCDLVIGQQVTPTFATMSEKVWGYRSIEKTITDMRGLTSASSTDLGAGLFGTFDKNKNYGYEFLVANGAGARFETNTYKKVYTSLYASFWDKKIVVQANYDYDRTNVDPVSFNNFSKTMIKGFIAYKTDPITVGVEVYMQTLQNYSSYKDQNAATLTKVDTVNGSSMGVSAFVRGRIIKDKLNFFARYDMFNPDTKFNSSYIYTRGGYKTGANVIETFITAGLDWTPDKSMHIMPNIWMNQYADNRVTTAVADANNNLSATSPTGKALPSKLKSDYDLVVRVTFWYIFK